MGNLALGDWGTSYATGEQVVARIGQRLPATLYLMGVVYLLTLAIALPVGVIAAIRQY